MISASIILCTHDRAASLGETLRWLREAVVAASVPAEIIVVDNGSADQTPAILQSYSSTIGDGFVTLRESRPGKSACLNQALRVAKGQVLLFTDDDVRPPTNWVERMTQPIANGDADAVAGGVRLAESLRRPWLGVYHRQWLASTEDLPKQTAHPLIGANMAVGRHVFDRVPGFDPEVGPGAALGHAEDTLFWLQLREAGYRIVTRLDIEVEHHVSPDRLSWHAFARLARKRGEFAAYVEHHWEWYERPRLRKAFIASAARLWAARLAHLPSWLKTENMPAWELPLLDQYHERRCLLRERRRERAYDRRGLWRRDGKSGECAMPARLAGAVG